VLASTEFKLFPTSYDNSSWIDVKIGSILQKVIGCSGTVVHGDWKGKLWSQPISETVKRCNYLTIRLTLPLWLLL